MPGFKNLQHSRSIVDFPPAPKEAEMTARPKLSAEPTRVEAAEDVPHAERALEGVLAHAGREQMIAEAAYYRAERRGFAPGAEIEDWLAAEREIEALVREAA
jgi:hypothetical protein